MRNLHRVALTIGLLAAVSSLATHFAPRDRVLHSAPETAGDRQRATGPVAVAPAASLEVARPSFANAKLAEPSAGRIQRLADDAAMMARDRSREGGNLELRDVVPPRAGLEIVVTRDGDRPDDLDAPRPSRAAPRALLPPRGQILPGSDESIALRVTPAEASGEVLLADDGGEIFGRHAIPVHPSSAGRVLDLHLALPAEDSVVWLAHENPDGRRSAWRAVPLEEKP